MRVVLCGANGRMGREIAREIENSRDLEIVAGVDKNSAEAGFKCYASISDIAEQADVIMDFSHHSLTKELVDNAVARKIPLVIATTGQSREEREYIERAAEQIPIFFCGNMSLGVTLFITLVAKVAEIFPYADVEIVETHHAEKADVPSGTALMIADAILKARNGEGKIVIGRRAGQREKGEIGISSLRIGGVVGIHEVRLSTGYQSITLKHEAHSRALFATGALHAIRFIADKPRGLYSVKDFL
ncbi:MAG: 4-hydroxy-tetrahydrodipicolinate reductase [Bacteroides sp.]|nr:4-hydroxy-tetrahydrodipicolinate reductase [Bacillota bacterium]MCM1393406.1 4-hydroxy-tetrahydrodipicolinate reductase [[Eubacterium] siraeum]MCM1455392.1 4-hydroxy-tetrahydrodipicolinate reductase [Bacteroides sp.]